ncbi:helix-turn-helix domain-containing protein [Nocardioides sp. QY071]|uniref:TetR/AcrR family transcriptional regulator n=1 Tax=Nocardioides sp. QY071 TaxID=3044187 RepID=UPI00249B52C2|nr:TetR/AcrR family transcriptional regulator [Nocardioides sp. QY071]WGY01564.1 helix-turn-helix domain-containing protein [Nocardioides sp. QY071]
MTQSREDDRRGRTAAAAIVDAAFRLFAEHGYDATSVDDIAAAAGVSRSSFFRLFGSKEMVIFPDHDAILAAVEERLAASTQKSAILAVSDAVRVVLFHYIAEGPLARRRYQLTSTVPALRERELISGARYQQLFRQYISAWGDGSEESERRGELMAAAVVAAHNRVLRRWLREECEDPHVEIDEAMAQVNALFAAPAAPPATAPAAPGAILVVRTDQDLAALAEQLRSQ